MKAKSTSGGVWTLRAAKDRFSEVVAAAEKRPQRIVRAGRSGAPAKEFVLSVAAPNRRGARPAQTFADWLRGSRGVLDDEAAKVMDKVVASRRLAKFDPPKFD
jgi:hypothetical protein